MKSMTRKESMIDMADSGDAGHGFETVVVYKQKRSGFRCASLQCCYMVLLQVAIAVGVVYISNTLAGDKHEDVNEPDTTQRPSFQRQIGLPHHNSPAHPQHRGTAAWSSYYLDQEAFYKGKEFIPWEAESGQTSGIQLTNNSCFNITVEGVYNFYSKLTLDFTPENLTSNTWHSINLKRWNNSNGKTEEYILEKNVISVPNVTLRGSRVWQPSQLQLLRALTPGDVICVVVQDTSLVYHSKSDNTVNIYQIFQ